MKTITKIGALIIVFNLVIVIETFSAESTKGDYNKSRCSAYVENNMAYFIFPLAGNNPYKWYQDTTENNKEEYVWELSLNETKPTYNFGVYLYKFPMNTPQEGPLDRLIKKAQYSVWTRAENNKLKTREDLIIDAKVVNDRVVVAVRDRHTYDMLFKEKPQKVFFRIIQPHKDEI
jgi:hypothetical protein